jgi:hypothetical protein
MNNKHKQHQSDKSKSQQLSELLYKILWLTFLQGNLSFQGISWEIQLKCQPPFQTRLHIENPQK